jgi:hypothetical protein
MDSLTAEPLMACTSQGAAHGSHSRLNLGWNRIANRNRMPSSRSCSSSVTALLSSRARCGVVGTNRGSQDHTNAYGINETASTSINDALSQKSAWNRQRMHDMILSVGPKTPAATVLKASHFGRNGHQLWSSDDANSDDSNDDDDASSGEDVLFDEDESEDEEDSMMIDEDRETEGSEDGDAADGDQQEQSKRCLYMKRDRPSAPQNDPGSADARVARLVTASAPARSHDTEMLSSTPNFHCPSSKHKYTMRTKVQPVARPALQHGGCINTATWLTGGWRLSLQGAAASNSTHNGIDFSASRVGACASQECPTQLATAGDDRMVKFWDVSGAMGSISPVSAGLTTHAAFDEPYPTDPHSDCTVKQWREDLHHGHDIPGSVIPLGTLHTGHRGNIFHVTPVPGQPGQVATCAADGYLLVSHVEHAIGPPSQCFSSALSGDGTAVLSSPEDQERQRARSRSRSNGAGMEASNIVVSPEFVNDGEGTIPNNLAGFMGLLRSSGMCFSHQFLTPHVGLLCSERGLHSFDLRLPPREQPRQSVLHTHSGSVSGGNRGLNSAASAVCKACAIWDPHRIQEQKGGDQWSASTNTATWDDLLGDTYVFAGGASGTVGLYDLRMTGAVAGAGDDSLSNASNMMVESYRPKNLSETSNVSVSGLDVSKDGRELLVSYENDHIYSFPIGTTLGGELADRVVEKLSMDEERSESLPTCLDVKNGYGPKSNAALCPQPVTEVASYGGHLNRFTFLKGAKYAGPRDDYICTGSDSGHAWIYERCTGRVVSLLKADRHTCNGVIPHPTLPLFVTYGIDSTAKVWRATTPVVSKAAARRPDARHATDESSVVKPHARSSQLAPVGTSKRSETYHKSTLVRQWNSVQQKCLKFIAKGGAAAPSSTAVGEDGGGEARLALRFPDTISQRIDEEDEEDDESALNQEAFLFHRLRSRRQHEQGPQEWNMGDYKIANNLRSLPDLLQLNYDTCAREVTARSEGSVKSGLGAMARRVSAARLRHQADRLGLRIPDEHFPWIMVFRHHDGDATGDKLAQPRFCHDCDLIPDFPVDWMPYDAEMTPHPKSFTFQRQAEEVKRSPLVESSEAMTADESQEDRAAGAAMGARGSFASPLQAPMPKPSIDPVTPMLLGSSFDEGDDGGSAAEGAADEEEENGAELAHNAGYSEDRAWKILIDTVSTLKQGGNEALRAGGPVLAAQRYDKGINYCALAFVVFACDNLQFLKTHQHKLLEQAGVNTEWTPLYKLLITLRLNLALVMEKPQIADCEGAIDQAKLALIEIKPFSKERGRVVSKHLPSNENCNVSNEVYGEAKEMEAKAYFRLGTAHMGQQDYHSAMHSLEKSVRATKELPSDDGGKKSPEPVVLKRLAEAKRENARRKERYRKKLKFSLGGGSGSTASGAADT